VVEDIRAVVDAAKGCPMKVILETCYLPDEEKIRGCGLVMEAGASFANTSTGYLLLYPPVAKAGMGKPLFKASDGGFI
jgi:deoxyribose-phosphate aldolase